MINRFFSLEEAERFWSIISPVGVDDFVEVRLTPTVNVSEEFWFNCRELRRLLPTTPVNKSVCFFIRSFEELRIILSFKNGWFCVNSKVCYGLNHRSRTVDGLLNGSYDCVKSVRLIGFDLEARDHSLIDGFKKELFEVFVRKVVIGLEFFGFKNPSIVWSGAGVHLLYLVVPVTVTVARREWFKDFVNDLSERFSNELFVLDALKDFTRVFGLPGSYNVKRGRLIVCEKVSSYVSSFRLKSKRVPKVVPEVGVGVGVLPVGSVKGSLEFQLLLHVPPAGERHQVLVFALKLLLKASGVDHRPFEVVLKKLYGDVVLNPVNGTSGKVYNKGIVINYCRKYWSWVVQYPLLVRLFNSYVDDVGKD